MRATAQMGLSRIALFSLISFFSISLGVHDSFAQTTVTLGSGTQVSTSMEASPINLNFSSLRAQFIYPASEIIAAGGSAGDIIELGFNVVAAPNQALSDFNVRVRHTDSSDVTMHDVGPFETVLTLPSYSPTAGGFDLLTLDTPFTWNGTDNILIETCFFTPGAFVGGGTLNYDLVTNSFRFITGTISQCGIVTSTASNTRPQIQLTFAGSSSLPVISVSPDSLSATINSCDDSVTFPVTIYNTGTTPLNFNIENGDFLIYEDFEDGNYNGWTVINSSVFTPTITSSNPGSGNYSLQINGGNNSHFQGLTRNFGSSQPNYISLKVKSGSTFLHDGYFIVGNSTTLAGGDIFFYFQNTGLIRLFNGSDITSPYIANQWYHIEFDDFDYANNTFDYYVDGQKLADDFSFSDGNNFLDVLHLYNYNNSTAYYDDIIIGDQGLVNWISVSPDSGIVAVGDSIIVQATISSDGLNNGNYQGLITINSNDPTNPTIQIPVSLTVNGSADLALSTTCLAFDSVMQFTTVTDSFSVYNTGCDTLQLNNITSTDPNYAVVNFTAGPILPGDSISYSVDFSPDLIQNYPAFLVFSTNLGLDSLCLSGTGIGAPIVGIHPDSLVAVLNSCDDSVTIPITVYNMGASPLNYNTSSGNFLLYDDFEDGNYNGWTLVNPSVFTASVTQIDPGSGNYSLQITGGNSSHYQGLTQNFGLSQPDYISFKVKSTSTTLQDALFIVGNSGNLGVSDIFFYNSSNLFRIYDGSIFAQTTYVANQWYTIVFDDFDYVNQTHDFYVDGQKIANDFNFRQGNSILDILHLYNFNNSTAYYDDITIGDQAFLNWVSVSPDSGVIAMGDSAIVQVTLSSKDLDNGIYQGTISINSNDPANPTIQIPISLTVNGTADIALSTTCLAFDSVMQFTTAIDSFTVYNTGCDTLQIANITSTDAEYAVLNFSTVNVLPGDSINYTVTFSPNLVQPYPAYLLISSNLGLDSLCLSGTGIGAPIAQLQPDSLSVTLVGCDDSLIQTVQVINTGQGVLNWQTNSTGSQYQATSFLDFSISGATTSHFFSGVPLSDTLEITVILNGDFDGSSEYADLYVEGTFITQIPDGNLSNGTDIIYTHVLTGPQLLTWLADGTLAVDIVNSIGVNPGLGGTDDHEVTVNSFGVGWLTAVPNTGNTAIGDTSMLQLEFNGTGLNSGIYDANFCLTSNDPINPQICIPVQLIILGQSAISFSDSCADLGAIQQFTSTSDTVWVFNPGCDSLTATNLTVSDTVFSIAPNSFVVAPGDSLPLAISFSPIDTGYFQATLDIFNNAGDTTLCLTGYSQGAPVISVIPDSLFGTISGCDDSTQLNLQILNTGLGDLTFEIDGIGGNTDPIEMLALTYGVDLGTEYPNTIAAINQYYTDYNLTAINTTSPTTLQQALQGKDVVLFPKIESGLASVYTTLGQVLFDFVNNGGSIVFCGGNVNHTQAISNTGILSANFQGNLFSSSLAIADQGHPVMDQINFISALSITTYVNIPNSAFSPLVTLVGQSSQVVAGYQPVGKGIAVYIGYDYFGYNNQSSQLIANAVKWAGESAALAPLITVVPDSSQVAPGDSLNLQVNLFSAGLNDGIYDTEICINSNDPVIPQICVPVKLTVIGVPALSLPDSCLYFPQIMQFTTATDSFLMSNTGCDTLFITQVQGIGDAFNPDTTAFAILPGDSLYVPITFSPDTVGFYSDTLTFFSNAGDSTICITGSAFGAPTASINPQTLNVTIPGCADSLTVPLTINNTGLGPLTWTLVPACNEIVVQIMSGAYAYELSWEIVNSSGQVIINSPYYGINGTTYIDTFCLEAGIYTFRAKDSWGDGWNGGTATVSSCLGNLVSVTSFYSGILQLHPFTNPFCGGGSGSASWTTYQPSQDTTAISDSSIVDVTFNSQGLVAGTYQTTLLLLSNDPLNSPISIPVILNITGAVSVAFSDSLVQFDSTMLGFTDQQNLTIYNALCDTMEITSMVNSDPVFGFTANFPIIVPPFDSLVLPMTFDPTAITSYSDSLLITYKAKDSTTVFDSLVYLQGNGIGTPQLSFAPDSINATLNACLDSVTIPVTLYSNGSGTVNWTANISASSALLTDDFESGTNSNLWNQILGGFINANCGTGNGIGALYFNGGSRIATTVPVNTLGGGAVNFGLRVGTGSSTSGCENADPGEEVVLEYSLDGFNWNLIRQYHVDSFPTFTAVQEPIPTAATSTQTQFRWRQKGNSGSSYDHWAIDDVAIITGTDSSLNVQIDPDNGLIPVGDSTIIFVTISVSQLNNGTYPLLIELLSNDPIDSIQYIPGLLTITGQPVIELPNGTVAANESFCFGDSIELVSDLTGIITWSTGEITPSIFIAETDTVSVSLTYPNGCTIESLPIYVEELPAITTSIVLAGAGNGCAGNLVDLTVNGGAPGYTYLWNTGQTSQDITINAPGTFSVLITDSKNCTAVDTLQIDSLVVISVSTLVTDVLCYGDSSGAIDLTVTGGDGPYTYAWNNGEVLEDQNNLPAGFYSVTVADTNGCTAQTTVQITQPSPLNSYFYKSNVSCFGGSNGAINLIPYGGTQPYQYQWSNGPITQDQNGLPAGIYSVTITDFNGCTATNSVTISQPTPILITEVSSDSCGLASLDISVSGGSSIFYYYQWSNGTFNQDLNNVPPGVYSILVTNGNGCTATDTFQINTVPPPPTPTVTLSGSNVLCTGDVVTLTSSATQNILWSNGQTTSSITVAQAGTYTVTVTDTLGCTSTSVPVVISVLPDAFITASANPICNGQTITLTVNNAISALWSTGDTTLSIQVSPNVATSYSVGAVNDSGCAYVDTITVGVLPAVPPDSVTTMIPADGAMGISLPLTLSWPSANNAGSYDIFIWEQGSSQPSTPTASNLTVSQYITNSLNYGTAYQWQVIAKNNCFSTPGVVQVFSLIDLPDLVVDTILVPTATVFSGQNICVNWRVRNQGLGDANGTWTERVYLSQNQVYDPGLDPLVGTVTNTAALAAGDTSTLQQICFNLPGCILGNYYVFVFVDPFNAINETDETNNSDLNANNPLDVDLPPQPDLQVTDFFRVGAGPLASGSQLCVHWEVTNLGDSLTNDSVWTDRLYLATDSIFNPASAVQIYNFTHNGAIDSSQSYAVDTCLQLPGFVDGTYYLFLETDVYDDVDECSPGDINEMNNVSDGDTIETFLAPPPDLVATNLSAGLPTIVTAGSSLTVNWTTQNQGLAQTFASIWSERIYLSPVGGGATINLGNFNFNATLTGGYSANRSQSVIIPAYLNGDYNLCVVVDVFNQVYEYLGETNNTTCSIGQLTIEQPDLVITNIGMPTTDSTGNPIPVTYYQKNNGPADIVNKTIYDRLYWSNTPGGPLLYNAGFPNYSNTTLLAGDSILRTTTVSAPPNQSGTFFLCIQTDQFNSIGENNETNNITCGMSLDVKRPDFVVSNISTPSVIQAGSNFSFTWTTLNQGGAGVLAGNWTDCIFLSATQTYNSAAIIPLADLNYGGTLGANDDTTHQQTLMVGAGLAGTYFIGVYTDCDDDIDEANQEGNNVLILSNPIQVVVPDLIVSEVDIPAIDSTGNPIQVSWTVNNVGLGDVINGSAIDQLAWTDSIGGTLIPIQTLNWNTPLFATGDSVIQSATIQPPSQPGPWYLCITTDQTDQINESDELNNITCSDSISILRPDLVVNSVNAPNTVTAAQAFTTNWTTSNAGQVGLNSGFWSDCIFISPTNTYDPTTAITIGQLSYGASLGANGGNISQSTAGTVPYGISGTYYLGVYTDCANAVGELDKENNNITFLPGTITIQAAPAADLIPTMNALMPDTITAGDMISVDYTISNQGDSTAFSFNWFDGLYLSTNSNWPGNFSTATHLNSFPYFQPLPVGSSYSKSVSVSTSANLPAGWYYVYVYADDTNQVYEDTLDNNNWIGDSIYIEAYPPVDLSAISINADSSAILPGNSLTIDYQVENIGQGTPLANNWVDGVYLSTDSIWDVNDDFIAFYTVPGQVPPGTIYARFNETVTIPLGYPAGNYYLLMRADTYLASNDIDSTNNYIGVPLTVKSILYPDLQVNSFSCPGIGTAGQPITFNFSVVNDPAAGGGTSTGGWSEGFYLQSASGLIFLGSFGYTGNLASGSSYSNSVTLTLPISLPAGFYDIIMRTDRNNVVFEDQNEGNNESICNIQINATPPADLIVSEIIRPDTTLAGDPLMISWEVKNVGLNPATGTMTQGVYISTDTIFSSDDIFFGSISGPISMAPMDSVSYSLNGDLLGVSEGCFHVIVRTDVLNNIIEAIDMNNALAAPCMQVEIPILPFDVLTPDILVDLQEIYYRIIVDSSLIGESMIVTLKGDSTNNAFNEEYLRFGDVPTKTIYDYTVDFPFAANQTVIAPDIEFGTYYHMTYGQTNGSSQQNITLLAEILPFEIRKVNVNYGGNTGPVTVKIQGGRFEPGMDIRLESPSLGTITASNQVFINSTALWATFDLIGQPLGKYDVGLYKDNTFSAGADTALLDTAFTVQQGPANGYIGGVIPGTCSPGVSEIGQLLQEVVDHPPNTRPNRIVSMTVYYENIGNVDLPIPTRFLLSTSGAPIAFTPGALSEGKTELFLEYTEAGSPPGLLRPGGKGSITVYTKAIAPLTFELVE